MKLLYMVLASGTGFIAASEIVVKNEDRDPVIAAIVYTTMGHTYVVQPPKINYKIEYTKINPKQTVRLKRLPIQIGYDRDLIVGSAYNAAEIREIMNVLNGYTEIDLDRGIFYLNLGTLQAINEVRIDDDSKPIKVR